MRSCRRGPWLVLLGGRRTSLGLTGPRTMPMRNGAMVVGLAGATDGRRAATEGHSGRLRSARFSRLGSTGQEGKL